jgi:hypothetical protein
VVPARAGPRYLATGEEGGSVAGAENLAVMGLVRRAIPARAPKVTGRTQSMA